VDKSSFCGLIIYVGKIMSFLDDTIIVEVHLKNKGIFKSKILDSYNEFEQSSEQSFNITFNLVKFQSSTPFPGFELYMRVFLGDKDAEFPDIEEKYVAFIIASEISFLRLMESSDLNESDKTLLLVED